MSSLKTTIAGICAILAAVTGVVSALVQGHPVDWTTAIAAITAGIGLITARDNNVTSEKAGAGK